MHEVKIQDNKCIIKLNNVFYPREIVEQAAKSFDSELDITMKNNDEIQITTDNEIVGYEFFDHLLSIMQGGVI